MTSPNDAEAGHGAVREAVGARDARLVGGGAHEAREPLVADERLRVGVLEDVGDLGSREPVVDRHVVPAGLERGEVEVHRVGAVREHRGDRVAPLETERAEPVDDLVGAGQHVAGRVLRAVGVDDREIPGIFCCVLPKAHEARPLSAAELRSGRPARCRRVEHVPRSRRKAAPAARQHC